MAHTKQSCFDLGKAARNAEKDYADNPFRDGSWQAAAWSSGYMEQNELLAQNLAFTPAQKARNAAEAGRGPQGTSLTKAQAEGAAAGLTGEGGHNYEQGSAEARAWDAAYEDNLPRDTAAGVSIPFPANMPRATREHIRRLEAMYDGPITGDRLVRLSKKVEHLYQKWA